MNKKLKGIVNEYLKEPTFALLLIFLFFLGTFLYKTLQIENISENYNKYDKAVTQLLILDNDFDIFLSQKLTFINYDVISNDIKKFEKNLLFLKNHNFIIYYGQNFKKNLLELKANFKNKTNFIERYKSYNATTISSLSYIFNFMQSVSQDRLISNTVYKAIFDLTRLFIGIDLDKKTINNDIKGLKAQNIKGKINGLGYLYINIKNTMENIWILNTISRQAKAVNLKKNIQTIKKIIDNRYEKDIYNLKISGIVLFITALLLLFAFIYKYIIFLQNAKDLTSFKYAVENSDNTVVMTDANRHITYVNEAFTKNTGYTKDEVLGENPRILKSGLLPQKFYDEMNNLLDNGQKWSGDFINKDKHDKIFYEKASITPMFKNKKLIGYLAIKLNVTDYIEQEKRVVYLANHDQLTGLKNRRAMEYEINRYIKEAKSNGNKIALLFLDLDNFKIINDSLGHDKGDLLLKSIAKRLKHNLDNSDTIYRFGGDEFAIAITKNISKENIFMLVKRIMKLIRKPVVINNNEIKTSASLGIAFFPEDGDTLQMLLKNADIAMYNSKMSGKDRYRFYYENFSKEIQERINIERELGNAISNKEFYVVYQPKYSLETKQIFGLELLIRWRSKKLGTISPSVFIPIAESLGLIYDIGQFVFKKACEDFEYLKSSLKELKHISINVSTAQFNYQNLKKDFKKIMDEQNTNPKNLAIEITETSLMKNIEENAKILNNLKKLGLTICMDDFGTGYSSLNYLLKLPLDNIKIDKTFVDVVLSGQKEAEMIKAIVSIGKSFSYNTVAEGIETKEQEDTLRILGVDYGQGYYFCKPMTKENLVEKFALSS